MAELILTDEEKAAKNWLDVSDDTLGKVCRKTMLMLPELCKGDGKKGVWFMSCLNIMIGLAHDANSETSTFDVTGFTVENADCGDWKVTIKRTDKRDSSNPHGSGGGPRKRRKIMSENESTIASGNRGDAAACGPSPGPGCSTFIHLRRNNLIAARIMDAGGTAEDCAVALSVEYGRLLDRVMALDSIAPRKIRLPDGRVLIWRCPDELVPESPMLNPSHHDGAAPAPSVDGVVQCLNK